MTQQTDLWVEQHLWVHADWSPAAPGPLRDLAGDIVLEVDPSLSVVTRSRNAVDRVAWAFAEADGSCSILCQTTRRETAEGQAKVARALARCLENLAAQDVDRVDIDGHETDVHLAPVLRTLPHVPSSPVHLIEIL